MPVIKSSAELRNNYNQIATQCHEYQEPIFITRNGKGDLAIMSIENYERMQSKIELYEQLKKGMDDVKNGRTKPFDQVMNGLKEKWHLK